jgi:thiamine pyrophosphate-dependent acetolactate synthase large subunit-like protein
LYIEEILMNRAHAISSIIEEHSGAIFVLSNGLTSREGAFYCPNESSFYLLHAMGEALSVGLGIASTQGGIEVVVIDGDGNALMGASSWTMDHFPNLHYYVLVNSIYETTGGQALPNNVEWPSWCKLVPINKQGPTKSPNPPLPGQIWQEFESWLNDRNRME